MKIESKSVEETLQAGRIFAATLKQGDVVCLEGDLGAGKTHFVKGMASSFGIDEATVSSPTFTLINEYKGGTLPLYHFDAYRLKSEQEALEIGTEEYLYGDGVSVIEWPSKISGLLPEDAIRVEITHQGDNSRTIHILGD